MQNMNPHSEHRDKDRERLNEGAKPNTNRGQNPYATEDSQNGRPASQYNIDTGLPIVF